MGIVCRTLKLAINGRWVIIRMLNPFAIEKELLAKTDTLSSMLVLLKGLVSTSVIKKHNEGQAFSASLVRQCWETKQSMEMQSKLYVCKVCGKEFNEGRKLGGHVSRAHKGSQLSIPEVDSDTETYLPQRKVAGPTVRAARRSQLAYFEEEDSNPEVYVPRASKRRTRMPAFEEEEETCSKKLKVDEPIFYEEP
jgi:hypothetical protein